MSCGQPTPLAKERWAPAGKGDLAGAPEYRVITETCEDNKEGTSEGLTENQRPNRGGCHRIQEKYVSRKKWHLSNAALRSSLQKQHGL